MSTALSEINLNRLLVFVAVVEAGSLTGAAGRLGLAKTMVSTHMQRLEAELGANLLVRTTRRLTLTGAGERFYEAARGIVKAAEEAVDAIGQEVSELRGSLRITAPLDYGASVIAPLLVELGQRHPALKLELLASDRKFDLAAEGIDAAIRLGRLADSSYQATRLAELATWPVIRPDLLAPRQRIARPEDLSGLPYVALSVLPQPLSRTFAGPGGERQTAHFQTRFSANTAPAVRAAVLAGAGFGILPDYAVADDLESGRLRRLLPRWSIPGDGVYAVFPATRYRPQKVRVLIDALKQRLGAG